MKTPIRISREALECMTTEQFEAIQSRVKLYEQLDHADVMCDYGISKPWLYCIWHFETGNPLHMGVSPKGETHT